MKKIFLTAIILFLSPLFVFAVSYQVYYDYSSGSYQCVNPNFTVEYVNGSPTCGGVYYNQESGQNQCLGSHETYSAGDCICDFGYVKKNGVCVLSTSDRPLTENMNAENEYQQTKSSCAESGGDWQGNRCDCPGGCTEINNVCVAAVPSMEDLCTGSGSAWSGGSNWSGGGVSSGSSGSSGGSFIGGTYTSGNSGGSTNISMPTVTSTGTLANPIKSESFAALIDAVVNWILNIALVLAPLVIVYGGFMYMTAAGDTNKVSQAKSVILYAVIGFIVALLAKSLINMFVELIAK